MKRNMIALALLAALYTFQAAGAPADPTDDQAPDYPNDPLTYSSDDQLAFNRTAAYTRHSVKLDAQNVTFRAFNQLPYVVRRSCRDCQKLDIYIPDAYFEGGIINGYTAKTAPIFVPNAVSGFLSGKITPPQQGSSEVAVHALARGYVVVSPTLRGSNSISDTQEFIGKFPAALLDYKAVVLYLKHNRERLPAGDPNKIISGGVGSGGALSALLGVSGNSPLFKDQLSALGAPTGDDSIFASVMYSPLSDLDHADQIYEWMFRDEHTYLPRTAARTDSKEQQPLELSSEQLKLSAELAEAFPAYLNSLNLHAPDGVKLSLNSQGQGTFADYLARLYQDAASEALERGEDLAVEPWAEVEGGQVRPVDLRNYARIMTRIYAPPAFDSLQLTEAGNNLFAQGLKQPCHFNDLVIKQVNASPCAADPNTVQTANPLTYINSGNSKLARYFFIRHGTLDRNVPLAIPAMLALSLQNRGATVNFEAVFHRAHTGDYALKELFDWLDRLCKTP